MGQVDRRVENSNILFLAGAIALIIILRTLAEQTAFSSAHLLLSAVALIVGALLFFACFPASEGSKYLSLRVSAAIMVSLISVTVITVLGGISPEQGQLASYLIGAVPILCLINRARA